MLYKETVTTATLGLLKSLMNDNELKDFILVGGTALSLQIGHRVSVDLDLFSPKPFKEGVLSEYLVSNYGFEIDSLSKSTVRGEINGIQVDCLSHIYPTVKTNPSQEGIRLAGLEDITAMKLNAISQNGTRIKDFIDIAYLTSYFPLEKMLDFYITKYKTANAVIPLKAIAYFKEINFKEPIKMVGVKKLNWKEIETRLIAAQRNTNIKFPSLNKEKKLRI